MASSVSSRAVRPARPDGGAKAELILLAEKAAPRKLTLQKGDLLAIPLCILWGVGLWLSSYGPLALFGPGQGAADAANPISVLWNLPVAAVKYLFGG